MTASVPSRVHDLLDFQDGVITRRQALASGMDAVAIRRKLHRREWAPVFRGVYVAHTGPLTWNQRAWAAVLDASPAALSHSSALSVAGSPVHIAIDRKRTVATRPGVIVHRVSHLNERTLWTTRPPRIRTDEALVDLAAEATSDTAAVAVLADAVGARRTTADRLLRAVEGRERLRRRRFLVGVLSDVRQGTCSVLEQRYLRGVERPHGLPRGCRQEPTASGRPGFRDVDYDEYRVVVELDGWRWHADARARDRDLERDLDAAADSGRHTVRLGWGQVCERPCATARKLGRVLQARGWAGTLTGCPRCTP
ncbi:MAG: hypothetical protein QM774_09755 [Gordonia sp. (in: high G+C Gram-positive bacteria)]|uniref:type IV toxin-antitoxin system AbiEi family antitoxin domain-containing protein n=1 Tax=Gordonia sp. (in: high G+C Gram-positive bacteria) TaxID=84139 RepID=UPI0039E32417